MTTVIKVGGSILSKGSWNHLIKDISSFSSDKVVLVHGGGPYVTELCTNLGIEPKFVVSPDGIRSRLTDGETISAYVMAMRGKVNAELVLALQKLGKKAFGVSGIDGAIIQAERKKRLLTINERGRKMFIDGGYTGRIVSVNSNLFQILLREDFMPVVAPIAISLENEPLNVDGDRAAAAVSGSLRADRLVILTDVDGVMIDGNLVNEISLDEFPIYLGKVGNGMDKKLIAAREAISAGTGEVIISNGTHESPIKDALVSNRRTVIRK